MSSQTTQRNIEMLRDAIVSLRETVQDMTLKIRKLEDDKVEKDLTLADLRQQIVVCNAMLRGGGSTSGGNS